MSALWLIPIIVGYGFIGTLVCFFAKRWTEVDDGDAQMLGGAWPFVLILGLTPWLTMKGLKGLDEWFTHRRYTAPMRKANKEKKKAAKSEAKSAGLPVAKVVTK